MDAGWIHGWVDVAFVVILLGSTVYGLLRGFGQELRLVLGQLAALAIAIAAIRVAWLISQRFSAVVLHQDTSTWPTWLANVTAAWRHAPSVGTWIAFGVCYLVLSSILSKLLYGVIALLTQGLPWLLTRSHVLGAVLGAVAGGVRVAVLGAAVFLLLQYFSIPWLSQQAHQSALYRTLTERVYRPWLQPMAARVFPVLARGALQPLAKNINLFAIPSGRSGDVKGVLLVPKPIAELSHRLTKGVTDPRQKAHILYEWEIHHVKYDWHKFDDYVYHHKWDQQSPLQTLRTGKGVCADYALLYADLCYSAGLTVQIDEGIGGTGTDYGSHAWNKVWLPTEHRWISVDTTWGAVQDVWFDVPQAEFDQTHRVQTAIVVQA
ncbi:MAG: transglutaminase domain-containing protein [Alicyclobacillus sp.]|nr:transglutaminase domain-containing protein [Alicyclobacillus sp.]